MKTKLRFLDKKVITDHNKISVTYTCAIKGEVFRILNTLDKDKVVKKFGLNAQILKNSRYYTSYFVFEITGVAKCHENDKFDATVGYRIAESRAKMKAYEKLVRICTDIDNILFKHHKYILNICAKNNMCLLTEINHCIDLTNFNSTDNYGQS